MIGALGCWASAFPGVRVGLHHFSPGHLALARYLVASLTLGLLSLIFRARLPAWRDWPLVALMGLLGFTIYNTAFNLAETQVEAGTASFIVNTAPIFSMILAMLFLGEEIPTRSWMGIFISFVGIALLTRGANGWHFEPFALLLLVPALSASCYTVLQKRMLERYESLGLLTATVCAARFPTRLRAGAIAGSTRRTAARANNRCFSGRVPWRAVVCVVGVGAITFKRCYGGKFSLPYPAVGGPDCLAMAGRSASAFSAMRWRVGAVRCGLSQRG